MAAENVTYNSSLNSYEHHHNVNDTLLVLWKIQQQQQSPFYVHYTGQPAIAGTSS